MHMLDLVSDIAMASSSSQMEISEPFRTEDLSKTDFFDFVTGSAPDMAITSSTGGSGTGGGNVAVGGGSGNNASNSRPLSGAIPGMAGTTVTDRTPGGRNGGNEGVNPMDGTGGSRGTPAGSNTGPVPDSNDQPLQGFDQFWGSDKDSNRLDPAMFEDLNRYCWIQQNNNNNNTNNNNNNNSTTSNNNTNNNGALNNQVADTDGQIYTLTVLNGAPEPWVLRKDPTTSEPAAPASNLDLDTILGGFPGYVKTECFSYDDSGFGTDHHAKDDQHQQQQHQQQHLLVQQQQQHAHHTPTQSQLQQIQAQQAQQQQMPVTSSNIVLSSNLLDPNSVLAYQNNNNNNTNNNNDWQMSDHNVIQQDTAESLLRSALQGKGYTKGTGLQLPNGTVTVLPAPGHMKDEELRRVLYSAGDPSDSLAAYADSTLASSIYDEPVLHSPVSGNQPNSSQQQQQQQVQQHQHQHQQLATGDLVGGETGTGSGSVVAVDDMFLTLDAAFPDDYEKLKRIATEVQQFCTDNNNYTEIIVEAPAIGNGPPAPPGTTNNNHLHSNSPATVLLGNHHQQQQHHQHQHQGTPPGMLLSPTDTGSLNLQPVSTTTPSDVVTTTSTTKAKTPRVKKNYKRSLSSSASNSGSPNPAGCNNGHSGPNLACLTTTASNNNNNNNNNTSMSNLNTVAGTPGGAMLSPNSVAGSNSTTTTTSSSSTTSPTQCGNGQRKERSLHYCSICSKGFKDKYSVNVHIRTHTGEKPFACSLCGKSFRQKAHLAKHYQTHLAQKNPAGGAVAKQSKQSRLSAAPLPDPCGQLSAPPPPPPTQAGPAVSLAVSNIPPGPPPGVTIGHTVQPQSPPMLLNNTATIVASR